MIGKELSPFQAWCHKILPLVYEDSLSYYEYLCKVTEYLNQILEQMNVLTASEEQFQATMTDNWNTYKTNLNGEWTTYKTDLTTDWQEYQTALNAIWLQYKNYIDNYFTSLSVQQEINNKLDNMVLDGTMTLLIKPLFDTFKTEISNEISSIKNTLVMKADKSEVTNVMTPKGTTSYSALPMSGNTIGWYYYCSDGDGTHGAGNYVWNGTAWYFGGTGDEGYNKIKKDLDYLVEPKCNQLFNKNAITNNAYVSTVDGTLVTGVGGYFSSDYITVKDIDIVSLRNAPQVAFYDINKTFISGALYPEGNITIHIFDTTQSPNVFFIRFSSQSSYIDTEMVNSGSTLLPYEEYTTVRYFSDNVRFKSKVYVESDKTANDLIYNFSDYLKTKTHLLIPTTIYAINYESYWMYKNNAVINYNLMKSFGCELSANIDNIGYPSGYDECNEYITIGGSELSGMNIELSGYIDETYAWRKGKTVLDTVQIVSKRKSTTGNKNIHTLFIGDSYFASSATSGKGILGYVKEFIEGVGDILVGKGTKDCCGVMAEAMGGWTEGDFYSNANSPFVFNGTFNFSQYLSTNNISNVDNIVFHLGMNGGVGTDIQNMINSIKTVLPNVKIFVCTVPNAQLSSVAKSDWYKDIYTTQRTREIQNKEYFYRFNNKESENIYLIPEHLVFNREYGLVSDEYEVARFTNVKAKGMSNHHPTDSGEREIAHIIFNYLEYANN